MAFRKIYDGLRLIAKALGTSSKLGEIEALELDPGEGYLTLHNGVTPSEILTADHEATITNKTISGSNNTLEDIDGGSLVDNSVDLVKLSKVDNNRILYSDLNGDIGVLDQLASQKVVITDSNGLITTANATNTEVDYLSGVTSNVQDQLDDKLDLAGGTMEGSIDMDDNSIINVPDPVSNKDAVNKQYVDAIAQGLDLKTSVRVATTTDGTLATSFENGQTVDGVTLVTGDRILIKNQVSLIENGIYVVQASGAPVRSVDADTWTKLVGAFCFVEEGTVNADSGWACNINATGVLGVNDVTFVQFSAAGVAEAGSGLTKTGTTFSVNVDNSTTEISGNNVIVKSGGISNTQVNASAAIDRSKLANGTASHVIINDGSGVLSSEATLAKSRGGSGQDNSSITFPASGTLATLAGTEVLTNKDIDGGTASDTSRLTLPKNTKANLDGLTRKEGTVVYATDQAKAFIDNGTSLVQIGSGSGGGGINYIENPDAEVNTDGWAVYSDRLSMTNVDTVGDAMDFMVNGSLPGSTPAVGTRIRYMGSVANGNMPLNTDYYVSTAPIGEGTSLNPFTFGVSTTPGGSSVNIASGAGLTYSDFYPYAPLMGYGNLATPDITWTRVTSAPMSGDAMFRLTKPASNCLGQGVAYDFTIDKADQGSVLTIGGKYNISSGTFATGDLTVYIYDITNKTVIQPSGFQVESVGSNIYATINATFQSAINSTSYRLIFHVSSTSSSAYTVDFDRISVGPQVVPMGAPVTDWKAFSYTVSALSGTLTNYTATGFWKQTGDTGSYKYRVEFNGTPGTWSTPQLPLPSGQVIDVAKIPGGSVSNYRPYTVARLADSSVGSYVGLSATYTTTSFIVQYESSGQAVAVTQVAPFTWTSGDYFDVEIHGVPIVGWSSSTVVSSSADTRVVTVAANLATVASHTAETIISWTERVDTHGAFSSTTFTAPVPGNYIFTLGVLTNSFATSTIGANQLYYKINGGTSVRCGWTTNSGGTTNFWVTGTGQVYLTAGQTLAFYSTSTNPCTIDSGNLSIALLQGPSQIAREEIIACRYTSDAAQSIANTGVQIVNFEDKSYDTHNAVTIGASWKFTAPAPGKYSISATVNYSTQTYAVGNNADIAIYKNGSLYSVGPTWDAQAAVSVQASNSYSDDIDLLAGDYIDVRVSNGRTAGATALAATGVQVSIKRLG